MTTNLVAFYIADLACWENNKNAYKTLIVADYNSVKVELAPNFEMGVTNKMPEFIKMNLIGKVALDIKSHFFIN